MRGIAALLLAMAGLVLSTPAAARERLLTPIDEWAVQPSEEYCLLVRTFQDPRGDRIRLQLQVFGLQEAVKFTMVGEGLPLRDRKRGVARFKFRFDSRSDWREAPGTTGFVDGVDALTFFEHLGSKTGEEPTGRATASNEDVSSPLENLVRSLAQIERIALAYPSRDDTVLQLGEMREPVVALRDCIGTMVQNWGYDASALANLRDFPRLTNGQLMAREVVQAMMRARLGQNDSIHFRMDIDEQGQATNCVIQHPRRGSEVEDLICEVLRDSAEFRAARDSAGKPVRAPLISQVIFGVG